MTPSSQDMTALLSLPVNNTPTNVPQMLVFSLSNDGYYFGKVRRANRRQLPTGCLLHVYYGGQDVYDIDMADLEYEYTQFTSPAILPNATNTAITFNETCQDTTTFPTLHIANVSIVYQGALPSSASASGSGSSVLSISMGGPLAVSDSTASPSSTALSGPLNTILGTLTNPGGTASSSLMSGSMSTTLGPQRTITITHSTCAPRSLKTVFVTATASKCPLTCDASSQIGTLFSRTSQASSATCSSGLYGSLCYTCGLTPTLITGTCSPTSTPPVSSTTTAGGSSASPACPFEGQGRRFVDTRGKVYALYCGLSYADADVGGGTYNYKAKRDDYGSNPGQLSADSFASCMLACDDYNLLNFKSGTPCRGVSFYESTEGYNCFLKASTNQPVPMNGVDSAKLLTLDPPADDGTSTVTVTSSIPYTVTVGGGSASGGQQTGGGGTGGSGVGSVVLILTATATSVPISVAISTVLVGGSSGGGGFQTITAGGGEGGTGGSGFASGFQISTATATSVSISVAISTISVSGGSGGSLGGNGGGSLGGSGGPGATVTVLGSAGTGGGKFKFSFNFRRLLDPHHTRLVLRLYDQRCFSVTTLIACPSISLYSLKLLSPMVSCLARRSGASLDFSSSTHHFLCGYKEH